MKEKEEVKGEFRNAPEAERIERFKALANVFGRKSPMEDFLYNVGKYPDRYKMEGKSSEEITQVFRDAKRGRDVIQAALDFYRAVQMNIKNDPGAYLQDYSLHLDNAIESDGFGDKTTHQLDVDRLTNLSEWLLNTMLTGGEKIGRHPNFTAEEVPQLKEDMRSMLKQVNAHR